MPSGFAVGPTGTYKQWAAVGFDMMAPCATSTALLSLLYVSLACSVTVIVPSNLEGLCTTVSRAGLLRAC